MSSSQPWPFYFGIASGEPEPASLCEVHSAFPVLLLQSPAEEITTALDCLHLEKADVWIHQYSLIASETLPERVQPFPRGLFRVIRIIFLFVWWGSHVLVIGTFDNSLLILTS